MSFTRNLNVFKKSNDLYSLFFVHLSLFKKETVVIECSLDTNHTNDGRERNTASIIVEPYPQTLDTIVSIDSYALEHGLYVVDDDNTCLFSHPDFSALLDDNLYGVLRNTFNDGIEVELSVEDVSFDNYRKQVTMNFKFTGEVNDFSPLVDYKYYVCFGATVHNASNSNYWGKLLIDGRSLLSEERYDLSFLLLFSAFDNLVTLSIEAIRGKFFSELDILHLSFGSKVSLLLNYYLSGVPTTVAHPVRDFIYNNFTELYDFRNAVAHGLERNITKDNCEQCLDLFIFMYISVNEKPQTQADLYNCIRSLK